MFDNINLAIQEPHKLIISNKISSIILLNYEDDEKLYSNTGNHIPLSKLTTIITKLLN